MVVLQEWIVLDTRAQTVDLDLRLGGTRGARSSTAHPVLTFLPGVTFRVRLRLLGFLPLLVGFLVASHPAAVVDDFLLVARSWDF